MRRLTHRGGLNYGPSVLADGSRLTFISDRTGSREVWLKDLVSGKESVLTRTGYPEAAASISRDGTRFAVWDGSGISVGAIGGGPLRQVCEHCGRPDDWFPDGRILVWHGESIDCLDPATDSAVSLMHRSYLAPVAPHLSPDAKWIVFHATDYNRFVRQIFIAPYTGQMVPQSEWIGVTDGTALDREAKWAPGGDLIYFLSERDGYRCIWARKLDPKTTRPLGPIYAVLHLHNPSLSPLHVSNTGSVKLSPIGDKLIFTMGELTGNLWLTELRNP